MKTEEWKQNRIQNVCNKETFTKKKFTADQWLVLLGSNLNRLHLVVHVWVFSRYVLSQVNWKFLIMSVCGGGGV